MGDIRTMAQLLNALTHGYTVKDGKIIKPQKEKLLQKRVYIPPRQGQHFCISIAGHTIGIDSLYSEIRSVCKNYLSDLEPEIRIQIGQDDLDKEREEAKWADFPNNDSYLETMAVHRKISEEMLNFNTFLMHGAVVAVNQEAYMFTAESGTGKTTHIKKWLNNLSSAYVVNGDKPLIKMEESQAIVCGTPWCGKEGMGNNVMVPLKAIVLMERGENNKIQEISFGQALTSLLLQTHRPKDGEKMKKTLALLNKLKGKVRFYRFVFNNLKDDAFIVSYQELTGSAEQK